MHKHVLFIVGSSNSSRYNLFTHARNYVCRLCIYGASTPSTPSVVCQMRLSEEPSKPSRVLHLRGLPPDTTEAEITQLTTLFGITTNIILTRQKNQVGFMLH